MPRVFPQSDQFLRKMFGILARFLAPFAILEVGTFRAHLPRKRKMDGNQSPETTCPKCHKPMKPVKGEIYFFCPLCWCRLDTGTEMRPRPHQKKGQGMASDEEGAKK
jgi:hypothetical protein